MLTEPNNSNNNNHGNNRSRAIHHLPLPLVSSSSPHHSINQSNIHYEEPLVFVDAPSAIDTRASIHTRKSSSQLPLPSLPSSTSQPSTPFVPQVHIQFWSMFTIECAIDGSMHLFLSKLYILLVIHLYLLLVLCSITCLHRHVLSSSFTKQARGVCVAYVGTTPP